jgi:Na+-driven multidrug efflux pump
VRVSIPSAATTVLTNLTFIVLTSLVAPFGESATAGYGSGGRLEYLLIPVVFGVGSALVPLVAASDGAGNFARVRQLTRTGVALSTGACGIAGGAVAMFPEAWMSLFTSDADVTAVGIAYLIRVGPAYPFLGLGLSPYFAAQGRGRTLLPLLASSTRLLVAEIGGAVAVYGFGFSLDVLFNLMAGGLFMYAVVMGIVMRRELGLITTVN